MDYTIGGMLLFDESYAGVVKRLLERARDRVLISQFRIDSSGVTGKGVVNQLLGVLVKRAEDGVKVGVLLDCILPLRGRSANNTFVALWLKKRHVEVKYLDRSRCQHAKVLVVDGEHAVIGSHNWTMNSLLRNSECSIYTTDVATVNDVEVELNRVFSGAREFVAR